jgi:uncharacterized caspase-like protein
MARLEYLRRPAQVDGGRCPPYSGFYFLLAGWFLSFAAPESRARGEDTNKAQKYALLVGVREYKTPALRTLKYSESDIEDLARVLRDAGFPAANLRILTQERAAKGLRHLPTSENIRIELSRMLKLVELADDPAATVLVALAGHGIMDPKAEKSYFCSADTSALNLSPDDPALIDLGALYDQLKASPAGFKLMLVDACRNDPLNPKRSTRPMASWPATPAARSSGTSTGLATTSSFPSTCSRQTRSTWSTWAASEPTPSLTRSG